MSKFLANKKTGVVIHIQQSETTAKHMAGLLESIANNLTPDELVLLERAVKIPAIKQAALSQLKRIV